MKTRQQIVWEMLRIEHEIQFIFTDASYWNNYVRQPHEPELNPDFDGKLQEMLSAIRASIVREKELGLVESFEICEGCGEPPVTYDSEGIPLCEECAKNCR
jgi:hypothetical protein